jgi:hypothetical protein
MSSSGMLHGVALVRTDVSEERCASITSVLTRATWHDIPGDGILHSHRRQNFQSYIFSEDGLHSPSSKCHLVRVHSVTLQKAIRLLVTASVVPSSPILVTLMKEALRSSETSVLTRARRRNIPEDSILYTYRRENLKSYIALTGLTL